MCWYVSIWVRNLYVVCLFGSKSLFSANPHKHINYPLWCLALLTKPSHSAVADLLILGSPGPRASLKELLATSTLAWAKNVSAFPTSSCTPDFSGGDWFSPRMSWGTQQDLQELTQLPWGMPMWTVNTIKLISASAQISPPRSMIYQELLLTTVLLSFIRHHRVPESLG